MSAPAPAASRPRPPEPVGRTSTSCFIAACRREVTPVTPVWFMRQAGRALPEYRELRRAMSMFEVIRHPEVAAEATLQPVRRYGVDAAILFSDITTPLEAVGVDVRLVEGIGPVFGTPFRTESDLAQLRIPEREDLAHVVTTARMAASDLDVPLIGFAGAPFTVASYLVEGRPSKTHATAKTMMLAEPVLWERLLDRLADVAIAFLRVQVDAGAAAVQLFDSWAGSLTPAMYERHVLPASLKVFAALADAGVPRIHFGVGTGELLESMASAGADVIGLDWRVPIADARRRLPGLAVQGNLDPTACLAPWSVVSDQVGEVLDGNAGLAGHIFNLGHGVLPETDPGVLSAIVELVHERTGPQP